MEQEALKRREEMLQRRGEEEEAMLRMEARLAQLEAQEEVSTVVLIRSIPFKIRVPASKQPLCYFCCLV